MPNPALKTDSEEVDSHDVLQRFTRIDMIQFCVFFFLKKIKVFDEDISKDSVTLASTDFCFHSHY